MTTCKNCKRSKPSSEFHRNWKMVNGHVNECKDCAKISNKNRRRSFEFYFPKRYATIVQRCHSDPNYKGLPYMDRNSWDMFLAETRDIRRKLHSLWVKSGYQLRFAPSVDRIDSSKGYVLGNCQWIPQYINCGKQDFTKMVATRRRRRQEGVYGRE